MNGHWTWILLINVIINTFLAHIFKTSCRRIGINFNSDFSFHPPYIFEVQCYFLWDQPKRFRFLNGLSKGQQILKQNNFSQKTNKRLFFFYPDGSEILETWISISSFKYFWVVRIEKQIWYFVTIIVLTYCEKKLF